MKKTLSFLYYIVIAATLASCNLFIDDDLGDAPDGEEHWENVPVHSGEGYDALDAMVADLPVVQGLISKSYPDLQILDEIATGDEFGIVVSKDNPELTAALNKALAELEEDGTIDALVEKWLS